MISLSGSLQHCNVETVSRTPNSQIVEEASFATPRRLCDPVDSFWCSGQEEFSRPRIPRRLAGTGAQKSAVFCACIYAINMSFLPQAARHPKWEREMGKGPHARLLHQEDRAIGLRPPYSPSLAFA